MFKSFFQPFFESSSDLVSLYILTTCFRCCNWSPSLQFILCATLEDKCLLSEGENWVQIPRTYIMLRCAGLPLTPSLKRQGLCIPRGSWLARPACTRDLWGCWEILSQLWKWSMKISSGNLRHTHICSLTQMETCIHTSIHTMNVSKYFWWTFGNITAEYKHIYFL